MSAANGANAAAGPSTPAPPASKPGAYVPMGALRSTECSDLLALVSAVSCPLEDAVADFLTRVPPERHLRFGFAVTFVLEVRL
ncbi:hypothetical protein ACP4OV_014970 [Aristida adscensionis]